MKPAISFSNAKMFLMTFINAIPFPLYVVDDDVTIFLTNKAGKEFTGEVGEAALFKKGGDVFNCVNALKTREGCGKHPNCRSCIIRNTVTSSYGTRQIIRNRAVLNRKSDSGTQKVDFLVTATPMPIEEKQFVLLVLEDISEFVALKDIIPICAHCKKIRSDSNFWESVESYFSTFHQVGFSHGICDDCMEKHYPEDEEES